MLRWPFRGYIRFDISVELTGQRISATTRSFLQPSTKSFCDQWLADW